MISGPWSPWCSLLLSSQVSHIISASFSCPPDSPQACLFLPTVPRSPRVLVLPLTIWVSPGVFKFYPFVHLRPGHSWRILLLHRLGRPSLYYLYRGAHCSMGLPEEGYVGRRRSYIPPMDHLDDPNVLGLREGRHRMEGCSFRLVPIGPSRGHHPGRQ